MRHIWFAAVIAAMVGLLAGRVGCAEPSENSKRELGGHSRSTPRLMSHWRPISQSRIRRVTNCRAANAVPAKLTDDVVLVPEGGRFGGALKFKRKNPLRPAFKDGGVLGYNDKSWSTTVSVWLRLDPDKDLEPGYCDPVQIVGDDGKKGFIFLEWSKDETPRYFRYALRPLFEIWNPTNVAWDQIPFQKRPMVQVERAPFSRDAWTHVAFTVENANDKSRLSAGGCTSTANRRGRSRIGN